MNTPGPSRQQKKKKKLSPILDQILNGGPSITLNILRRSRELEEGEQRFFANPALNRVIIFKYPNFAVEIADQNQTDYSAREASAAKDRPVETAIYIPNDEEFPQDGGYAVYLRQKDAEELLRRYIGVQSGGGTAEAMKNDWRKLVLIDEIPSLDPFLLKTTYDREKIEIPEGYLDMADREEAAIKQLIGGKVRPIVSRALGVEDAASSSKTARFIDAIWDPTIPEAALFIEAFKIDKAQAGNVFSAWKGVSFYRQQFTRNQGLIAEIIRWLRSDASTPIDIRQNRHYAEQQNMFKTSVQKKMHNILSNINQIFKDFDSCYSVFIDDGDPVPFRNFLVTSHYRYWILGYCCTSLIHCRNIFERFMDQSIKGQLTFEQFNDMLTNMDASLSSQSEANKEIS